MNDCTQKSRWKQIKYLKKHAKVYDNVLGETPPCQFKKTLLAFTYDGFL